MWRRSSLHPKKPNLAGNRDGARLYFLLSSTFLWCCNFQISALERTLSGCLLSISIDFTPFPVKLISSRTGIRMYTCRCISPNEEGKACICKVKEEEVQEGGEYPWYLPHFPVVRQDKATTKIGVVYDAAAKCGKL